MSVLQRSSKIVLTLVLVPYIFSLLYIAIVSFEYFFTGEIVSLELLQIGLLILSLVVALKVSDILSKHQNILSYFTTLTIVPLIFLGLLWLFYLCNAMKLTSVVLFCVSVIAAYNIKRVINTYSVTTKTAISVAALLALVFVVLFALSFGNARNTSAHAIVKQTLNNTRATAELYFDGNSHSYKGFCTSEKVSDVQHSVSKYSNNLLTCSDMPDAYVIFTALPVTQHASCYGLALRWFLDPRSTESVEYYCIDHTGVATTVSTLPDINAVQCPR